MPEGVGYKGYQSVANTGLDVSYWGDRAFAFSGEVNPNNSTVTALKFKTSKNGMDVQVMWGIDLDQLDADNYAGIDIKLNGILVYQLKVLSRVPYTGFLGSTGVDLFIPPLTEVQIDCSTDDNNAVGQTVIFTGKLL